MTDQVLGLHRSGLLSDAIFRFFAEHVGQLRLLLLVVAILSSCSAVPIFLWRCRRFTILSGSVDLRLVLVQHLHILVVR